MNAAQFYEAFLAGWSRAEPAIALKRLAGPTLKWKVETSAGSLTFAFATNSKTAGLLPHLPGEFRLRVLWAHTSSDGRKADDVSWFQYTSAAQNADFAALQRSALEKFLAQPGKEGLRSIYNYAEDPNWLPKANFEEFSYYFVASDAEAWGNWYACNLTAWLSRLEEHPESFNAWCWRVLWGSGCRRTAADRLLERPRYATS